MNKDSALSNALLCVGVFAMLLFSAIAYRDIGKSFSGVYSSDLPFTLFAVTGSFLAIGYLAGRLKP